MCRVPDRVKELVKQRLEAAAEEIFALVEETFSEYEEHLVSKYEQQRQQALLLPAKEKTFAEPDQIQILNAQGPVKEEQLLMTITQTLVKEESNPNVGPAPSNGFSDFDSAHTCSRSALDPASFGSALDPAPTRLKQEPDQASDPDPWYNAPDITSSRSGQDVFFIKEEPTEQLITPSPPRLQPETVPETQNSIPSGPSPDLTVDQNLQQNPLQKILEQDLDQEDQYPAQNQGQDLNEDLDDCEVEDNVEWEFEGLSSQPQSPEKTDNSSEEENTFPLENPPKLLRSTAAPSSLGQTQKTVADAAKTDEETTENSSDESEDRMINAKKICIMVISSEKSPSDRAAPTTQLQVTNHSPVAAADVRAKANDTVKMNNVRKKRKRKCRVKKLAPHLCTVCKRTFDSLTQLKAHAKVHAESAPCTVCGKMFKKKGFLLNHMRTHTSTESKGPPVILNSKSPKENMSTKNKESTEKRSTECARVQISTKRLGTQHTRAHESTAGQDVAGKTSTKHIRLQTSAQTSGATERKITKYLSTKSQDSTGKTNTKHDKAQLSAKSQETRMLLSDKRKVADSDHSHVLEKRRRTEDWETDTDKTEDSSDEN